MSFAGGGSPPAFSGPAGRLHDEPGCGVERGAARVKAMLGALIRVRESGGNTEADIGYDADGLLDETALLHTGAQNGGFLTHD